MIGGFEGWPFLLILVVQIICAVHVLRRGHNLLWLLFIVVVPLIGCAVYIIVHRRSLLPRMRVLEGIRIPLVEKLNERAIERAYHDSDTLDNRIAYANVLINRGLHGEAQALLSPALAGPLGKHVVLLFTAARAAYAAGAVEQALQHLELAATIPNNERVKQRALLQAMCLADVGRVEEAETFFRDALSGILSEEGRLRYALFLLDQQRPAEARVLLEKILASMKAAPAAYRREQAPWIASARAQLKALAETAPR